jgi:hypothetical protein
VLLIAAAAAHHATLIFGSPFFALPVIALVFLDNKESGSEDSDQASPQAVIWRTVGIVAVVGIGIAIVLMPYWIGLIKYPITQTPIPHPSRANYILSPQWGMNYFVVPYGALILALPFIIWKGAQIPRLRPLMIGFWLCFLVGLGL